MGSFGVGRRRLAVVCMSFHEIEIKASMPVLLLKKFEEAQIKISRRLSSSIINIW